MRSRLLLSLLICLLIALPSFGWWETGHRTVARIAAAYLNPKTRTRVAQILGVRDTPESVSNAMAVASTWPDETKGRTKTGEWHYLDLPLQDSRKDIKQRCPDKNCLPARIEIFQKQLAKRTPSGISDRDALRYLSSFCWRYKPASAFRLERRLGRQLRANPAGGRSQKPPFAVGRRHRQLPARE